MRFALIYGRFSTSDHGPYRVTRLDSHGLTGSESFFFNMVRALSERGHDVDAFGMWDRDAQVGKVNWVRFIGERHETIHVKDPSSYDVAISWNEPDYLTIFPDSVFRVCQQQLNDFYYCGPNWHEKTDLVLFPSDTHRKHVISITPTLQENRTGIWSNCVSNEDFLSGEDTDRAKRISYCSSPDRGLHWLCEFFPRVRQEVPEAELHVYYRYRPWYDRVSNNWDKQDPKAFELGMRARYTAAFFNRMGTDGRNGVFLHDVVTNREMIAALERTRVLAYPCDTVSFTEGFGVSVLDACVAGAVPVISDVDAFGEVYGDVAYCIPGRPAENRDRWIKSIVQILKDDDTQRSIAARCWQFAQQYDRNTTVERLLGILDERMKRAA